MGDLHFAEQSPLCRSFESRRGDVPGFVPVEDLNDCHFLCDDVGQVLVEEPLGSSLYPICWREPRADPERGQEVWLNDGTQVAQKGFFFGYDWLVWFIVMFQALGGLLVAVVVKYADNILKGFATSAAIVVSCLASVYFFDYVITLQFTAGTSLVILSVYLYGKADNALKAKMPR